MKSLKNLIAKRQQIKDQYKVQGKQGGTKILVSMGTCGMAGGGREVITTLMTELKKRNLSDVTLSQTGCIGHCQKEPAIIVIKDNQRVIYSNGSPERALAIIKRHIIGNEIIEEWRLE